MAMSRRLQQFVPGVFIILPQPQMNRLGPLRLPIRSAIPVGYLTDRQFLLWNALTVPAMALSATESLYMAYFPYRIPDENCITWSNYSSVLATAMSAIPF